MLLIGWGMGASYSNRSNRSDSSEGESFQRILGRLCDMLRSITNDVCVPVYSLLAVGYLLMIFVQQRKKRRRLSVLENEKEGVAVAGVDEALWNEADNFVDDEGGGEVGMVMVDGKAIQVKNMSGRFLLVKNEGFEEFLAAQGVPWALRKAANKACPLHHLTHVGNKVQIAISGIINSQTNYVVNGPPVETQIQGRVFLDHVTYLPTADGICTSKRVQSGATYNLTVARRLLPDGTGMIMTSTALFPPSEQGQPNKNNVQCIQTFQRIDP